MLRTQLPAQFFAHTPRPRIVNDTATATATAAKLKQALRHATGNNTAHHRPPLMGAIIERHSSDLPVVPQLRRGDPVLVGNRGTAAQRFANTAHELGFEPVAVVANGDIACATAKTLPLTDSGAAAYLDTLKLMRLCDENGIRHVWPGWGFWSESTPAHLMFRKHGIYVLGPEPAVVANMGDKTTAREIAIKAGAPVVPGTDVLPSLEAAKEAASQMGYPVLIKAVSGGGGKGMRTAFDEKELKKAFLEAKSEAQSSFNDDRVFMEKFVHKPIRHIEVQVFGDIYGEVRHFGTRHCSVQRRNQKVIEEAPAPREYDYLADIAVKIAKKAGYSGAGTVEFIVDDDGAAYFMEMNTRLQVEHGVTEAIHTGLDLVTLQLGVAEGKKVGEMTENVRPNGYHAIEMRLIKEVLRPVSGRWNTFPAPGFFVRPTFPTGHRIRIEANPTLREVNPLYDSNFGLIIASGLTRESAIRTAERAIENAHFGGSYDSNSSLLRTILRHPDFRSNRFHIKWLESEMQKPSFQKEVHDPSNPTNMHSQMDLLAEHIANISINGPVLSGVVNHVPLSLAAAVPAPKAPNSPVTWTLYGRTYTEAGGGEAGAIAVVHAWKEAALGKNRMLLGNTRYRDLGQTAIANRDGEFEKHMSAPFLDKLPFAWMEIGGGANTHADLKFKLQDPIQTTADLKRLLPNQVTSMLGRDLSVVAYGDTPLHEDAPAEIYRTLSQEGGIQKLRIFQGMNDIVRLKKAVLAASKSGAILDICMVFHKKYSSEDYAVFLHQLYLFSKEHGFSDRVIFTIKDAQGIIGMRELEKMKDTPKLLAKKCGEKQLIGIHSHDARGTTAAMYAKSAEYGYRHCDVANEKLAVSNAQPPISEVVHLLEGTPCDPQFPIEEMNQLTLHDLSVRRLWAPLMPENEITADQVSTFGLPPGMTNNVRQQFLAAGGKSDEFPRFISLYGIVLSTITCTTGVTPYSKDAGEIALWIMLSDKGGRIQTTEDIVAFMVSNAASAPNSTKNLLRGEKGTAQFGFQPDVAAAFAKLTPDQAPCMKVPQGAYEARIAQRQHELETKYSRTVPRHLCVIDEMFPGDVDALLTHEQKHGILTGKLPLHIKLRGLNPGETLTLPDVHGKLVKIKMVSKSAPREDGVCTVFMEVQGQPVSFNIQDRKSATVVAGNQSSRKKVPSPTSNEYTAPMPGTVVQTNFKTGDSVKEGDILFVIEAMKMRTSIPAKVSGILTLSVKQGDAVQPDELLATLK